MKKKILMLLPIALLLTGCEAPKFIKDIGSFFSNLFGNKEEDLPPYEPGPVIPVVEAKITYNFYLSGSHTVSYDPVTKWESSSPIFVLKDAVKLQPLGKCPTEVDSSDKILALAEKFDLEIDDTFSTFLGFSWRPTCLDEDGIWDFSKDYVKSIKPDEDDARAMTEINLYGIWVD